MTRVQTRMGRKSQSSNIFVFGFAIRMSNNHFLFTWLARKSRNPKPQSPLLLRESETYIKATSLLATLVTGLPPLPVRALHVAPGLLAEYRLFPSPLSRPFVRP